MSRAGRVGSSARSDAHRLRELWISSGADKDAIAGQPAEKRVDPFAKASR